MAAQPSRAPERVLRRSLADRVFAGVCGGLGRYLGVDPVIIRLAFVILALSGGSGVLLYLVALVVMPEEEPGEDVGTARQRPWSAGQILIGTALIALGSILFIDRLVPWFDRVVGPLTLIGLGLAVLVWGTRR